MNPYSVTVFQRKRNRVSFIWRCLFDTCSSDLGANTGIKDRGIDLGIGEILRVDKSL